MSISQDVLHSGSPEFDALLQIPEDLIKRLSTFRDRHLIHVLQKVYISFPDARSFLEEEVIHAMESRDHDRVQALLDSANLPLYPYHAKLKDFDPSCLNAQDLELYQKMKTLDFLYSDCPNITLFGPKHFGSEKLASGIGDAICRSLHSVRYTEFGRLLSILMLHGIHSKDNTLYEELLKTDCLIIEDFAGSSIHDRDLLKALEIFLEARIKAYREAYVSASRNPGRIKPRAAIITTCRSYEEWYQVFDCDQPVAISIISLFHGYGNILYIDETNKPNQEAAKSE